MNRWPCWIEDATIRLPKRVAALLRIGIELFMHYVGAISECLHWHGMCQMSTDKWLTKMCLHIPVLIHYRTLFYCVLLLESESQLFTIEHNNSSVIITICVLLVLFNFLTWQRIFYLDSKIFVCSRCLCIGRQSACNICSCINVVQFSFCLSPN